MTYFPYFHLACCSTMYGLLYPFPSAPKPFGGNPVDVGRIPPSSKKYSFAKPEKPPSPNSDFPVITQYKLYL